MLLWRQKTVFVVGKSTVGDSAVLGLSNMGDSTALDKSSMGKLQLQVKVTWETAVRGKSTMETRDNFSFI